MQRFNKLYGALTGAVAALAMQFEWLTGVVALLQGYEAMFVALISAIGTYFAPKNRYEKVGTRS